MGRSAALIADNTPSIARARVSIPPSLSCAKTSNTTTGSSAAKAYGAVAVETPAVTGTSSGQQNSTRPSPEATPNTMADRRPSRTWTGSLPACTVTGAPGPRVPRPR